MTRFCRELGGRPIFLYYLGCLGDLGRLDEALEAYNKAIEIKPDFHEAWHFKGIVLKNIGRKKEAKEAFKKAEEIEKKLLGR